MTALTNSTFDAAIAAHDVVLVDFWASWCGPCRQMAPDLALVAGEVGTGTLVAKVDVEQNPELSDRFGIRSIPTILTFHEGELRSRYVGAVPAAGLRAALVEASKPKRRSRLRERLGRR